MRIVTNKGQLELPSDISLEIRETNPFTQEVGSQSLPVSIPASEHNLRILGHPQRMSARAKFINRLQSTIQEGAIRLSGDQVVFSVSEKDGITSTFYLADGELYSRIKDVPLTDVDYGEPRRPFSGDKPEKIAEQWLDHFMNIIKGTATDEYAIFPVVTDVDNTPEEVGWLKLHHVQLLNQPLTGHAVTGQPRDFVARNTQTDDDGNTLPVGYGVTPFLYVTVVLRYIFKHFGYSLVSNPFSLHPQLNRMVVLNNTADAILGGFLDYRQLVPDVKVGDFLDCLRKKFDLDFLVNTETKEVSVRFFSEVVNEPADKDFSPHVMGLPTISFPEKFKQVVLKAGKGLEFAESETETLELFFSKYKYVDEYDEDRWYHPNFVSAHQIIYRKSSGDYWTVVEGETSDAEPKRKRISSGFFDYNKGSALANQEYEAKDEQVPVLHINFADEKPNIDDFIYQGATLPYIGQRRHLNSKIQTSSGELIEEKEKNNSIMFCFAVGLSRGRYFGGEWFLGTPLCYDDSGSKWGDFSLEYAGANGVFQTFWKPRDAILRHSYLPVKVDILLPEKELLYFRKDRLKLINGEPLLVNDYSYTIGNGVTESKEFTFYTTRLREPYNLAEEQSVPSANTQPYYWIVGTDLDTLIQRYIRQYTDAWGSGKYEYYMVISEPANPFSIPPPTQAQADAGGNYYVETYNVDFYIGKYVQHGVGWWRYDIVKKSDTYKGWYTPARNE